MGLDSRGQAVAATRRWSPVSLRAAAAPQVRADQGRNTYSYLIYFSDMFRQLPPQVLPTTEARARLSQIVADFARLGAAAEPVAFGSHRKPQGVIVPWELWAELAPAVEDLLDATEAKHRLAEAGDARTDFDEVAAALGRDPSHYR